MLSSVKGLFINSGFRCNSDVTAVLMNEIGLHWTALKYNAQPSCTDKCLQRIPELQSSSSILMSFMFA